MNLQLVLTSSLLKGMETPSPTSANCYCMAGSYQVSGSSSCVICEQGSYCEGGFAVSQCPLLSNSQLGSKTRSDCKCQNGTAIRLWLERII